MFAAAGSLFEPPVFDFDSSDDDDAVRSHIYCLTLLMGRRHCEPSRETPKDDRSVVIWSAISWLLSTGERVDGGGNRVVAVTGHIREDAIEAFIFARDNGKRDGKAQHPEITEIVLGSYEDAKARLLHPFHVPESEPQQGAFLVYVAETLTILRHLKSVKESAAYFTEYRLTVLLVAFTMRHTYRRIALRIKGGRAVWGEHPIRRIREWYHHPTVGTERRQYVGSCDIVLKYEPILRALAEANITFVDPETPSKFKLDSQNVAGWTDVLSRCLDVLEEIFIGDDGQAQAPTTAAQCDKALIAFVSLEALIRSGVIEALVTPQLDAHMVNEYNERQNKIEEDRPVVGDEIEDDNENNDTWERAPGESAGRHVRRYLSSMTIPYTACARVVYLLFKGNRPTAVTASLVTVTSPVEINDSVVPSVRNKLETKFTSGPQKEVIRDLLQRTTGTPNYTSVVHTEAALMAVAYAPPTGDAATILQNMASIPIGVPRKCCFCCALLGKRLNEWRTSAQPAFVLPGRCALSVGAPNRYPKWGPPSTPEGRGSGDV